MATKADVRSCVARSVLAGGLAGLLWGFGLFAVSGPLHWAAHTAGATDPDFCPACLLAKGQVIAADMAQVPAAQVASPRPAAALSVAAVLPRSDHPSPPGRAPPGSASSLMVAG